MQAQAEAQEDALGVSIGRLRCHDSGPEPLATPAASLPTATNKANAEHASQGLNIQQAFAGHTVLLTGVTGFVGSVVLEQLLRTCPDLDKVYLIVRDKHGMTGAERLHLYTERT